MKSKKTTGPKPAQYFACVISEFMCHWKDDGGYDQASLWHEAMHGMGEVYRGELECIFDGVVPRYVRIAFSAYTKTLMRFNKDACDLEMELQQSEVQTSAIQHYHTMVKCIRDHTSLDEATIDDLVRRIQLSLLFYLVSLRTQDAHSMEDWGKPIEVLDGIDEDDLADTAALYLWPERPVLYGLVA